MAIIKLNLSGHANAQLDDLGFVFPGTLHVDLTQSDLPTKVAAFLSQHVSSGDTVHIVLPGLSPLAAIMLTVVHGITGQFPTIVPLLRQTDGSFAPGQGWDLQAIRNQIARTQRAGLVTL